MASKILSLTNGKIAVFTPYHKKLIDEAKARMGKWQNVNVKQADGSVKASSAWVLDASHKPTMETLISELFPPRETLVERVIEVEGNSSSSPTVDGYDLVGFSRDRYWFKSFDGGEPVEIIHVMSDGLDTSGSRNNPRLTGKATIKLRCRPQAEVEWSNGTVEVVS